jgi:hypothetical protein
MKGQIDTASGADLVPLLPFMDKAYGARATAEYRNALIGAQREARGEARADRLALRDEKKAEKAEERSRERYIGEGFEDVGGDRKLSPSVVGDAQKRIAAGRQILKDTDQMLELLRTQGPQAFGDNAVKMRSIATNIQLNAKELKNLGVLNGPDLAILEKLAADPTQIGAIAKDSSGFRSLTSIFTALRELTVSDVNALAESIGFRPDKGGPWGEKRAGGGTVTVMWKGKPKSIPSERLQEALKAGATEVK